MSGRKARELPKIDIGGTLFYLDMRLNEFRECDNFMNRMNLNDLNEIEGGYLVCFDPDTKNYFEGSKESFDHRKDLDLVWVRLPTLQEMDPKGFEWLAEEIKEGSTIMNPANYQKMKLENETNKMEDVLGKAGLLFKPVKNHNLLPKKADGKSIKRKL